LERNDIIEKNCLFCPEIFKGTWQNYLRHMQDSHGFLVGPPENLVFVSEFIHLLESKMQKYVILK
jgi:hypothetical protein